MKAKLFEHLLSIVVVTGVLGALAVAVGHGETSRVGGGVISQKNTEKVHEHELQIHPCEACHPCAGEMTRLFARLECAL